MKVWHTKIIVYASITVFIFLTAYLLWHTRIPKNAVPMNEVVSYCGGDVTNDGKSEFLAIIGVGNIETGERCGQVLLVCKASAEDDMKRFGYIPQEKILERIDLTAIKPLKVQIGDVNGDGINEVAVCVYKTAEFHPIMAKRPFFFDLVEGNLVPVWLGSRLSRPFDDYILKDIDADGIDEIISIERLEDGKRVISVYNWEGFGFEMLTESKAFDGELRFEPYLTEKNTEKKDVFVTYSHENKREILRFQLENDEICYSVINNLGGLL